MVFLVVDVNVNTPNQVIKLKIEAKPQKNNFLMRF
jgi:hypothetical protein